MLKPIKRNTVLYRLPLDVKRKFRIIAANADSTMAVITRELMIDWINKQPVTIDNKHPQGWKPTPIETRAWAISHEDAEREWEELTNGGDDDDADATSQPAPDAGSGQ